MDPSGTQNEPRRFERSRILWGFARPHRRVLALGLVFALFGSAIGLSTPMVTKWVLDSVAGSSSMTGPILALLGLLAVGAVVWYLQWTVLGSLGERIVFDARESMVRRILRGTVGSLSGRPPGEYVTRVTSDTVLLRESVASSAIGIINGCVMLIGTLVLMGILDLVLLGTTVAAISVVFVLFMVLMPAIAVMQEQAQAGVGRVGATLEGAMRAVRTIKASRAEEQVGDRILTDARYSMKFSIKAIRREALAWTISFSGVQLAIIAILGVGAIRVDDGLLEVSSLIAFLLYAFGLMEPVMSASQNISSLQAGMAAASRIRDMESISTEIEVVSDPDRRGVAGAPLLEINSVSARYSPSGDPVVEDVTLSIPDRGHVAIVGPSGAGKTTIFSLILGFLDPVEGELRFNGTPYRELGSKLIRGHLAYVEQETPLVPGTLRENLTLSNPDLSEEQMLSVLEDMKLTDKVESLPEGMDTVLSSTQLSGGERQRIAFARALLSEPDLLLLDEATAQLDALTEAAIHDSIRRRAGQGTVLTIAHRLSTVIDADQILLMEKGRIRDRGTHAELLDRDSLYRDLVEALRIAEVEREII